MPCASHWFDVTVLVSILEFVSVMFARAAVSGSQRLRLDSTYFHILTLHDGIFRFAHKLRSAIIRAICSNLLAGDHRNWLAGRRNVRWSLGQSFFDAVDVQAAGIASLEAVEHFTRFLNLSGLVVEDAKRRITAGPLRQQFHGAFQDARPPVRYSRAVRR